MTHLRRLLISGFLILFCGVACLPAAAAPVDIGSRVQLFLDARLIDHRSTATLRLHHPVRREVVFHFDAPWEHNDGGYVTVLQDGDRYRMYYRGGSDQNEEVTCLAESADLVHWTRPTLGLFDYNGSKENNIVWIGREKAYWESHNFTPFIDRNPAAKPGERYKAVALGRYPDETGHRRKMLVAFVSPDGIHWKRLQEDPIIRNGAFDSQNLAFWDPNLREYACYSRIGVHGYRSVQRNLSKDFIHWTEGVPLDFGAAPMEQLYTNAIEPYFRNPALYIGLPMRFVPDRKTVGANHRPVDALSDGVLISSHDGLHFDRTFLEAFIRPGLDPLNWGHGHGNSTPAWGMIPSADNEISIFWCEHYGADYRLRRGTIRTDGFVSVNAPYRGGELVTRPLRFRGKRLILNYSTSAVGSVRVEIEDGAGRPLPGYSFKACPAIYGDEIARPVAWTGEGKGKDKAKGKARGNGEDVGALAGRAVRLRFVLRDADLYSFRFAP